MVSYGELYSNIFSYKLYIGLCLLLMLIYSVMYFFLAIYVERINPGEFGVPQPWNYIFKRTYWRPSAVSPADFNESDTMKHNGITNGDIKLDLIGQIEKKTKSTSVKISHLNKVKGIFF